MEKASYYQETESRTSRLAKFLSNLQISFIAGVVLYVIFAFVFLREGTDNYRTFTIVIQVVFWVLLVLTILSSVVMHVLARANDDMVIQGNKLYKQLSSRELNDRETNAVLEKLLNQYDSANEIFQRYHNIMVAINQSLDNVYRGQNSLLNMLTSISNGKEDFSVELSDGETAVPLNMQEKFTAIMKQIAELDNNIKESSDFQVQVYDGDVRYRLLQMYHVSRYKNTLKEDTSYLESFIKTMLRFQLVKQGKLSQLQIFNRIHYPIDKLDMSSQLKERLKDRSMYHVSDLILYDERFGDRLDDLEDFEIQIINRRISSMVSWFRIGAIPEIIMKANINII